MNDIDWTASAKLLERDDSGSDMDIHFAERQAGDLATLVAEVAAMAPADRARMVIDAGARGMLTVGDIVALAAHDDFPGNGN
jgi:hypothetical protein